MPKEHLLQAAAVAVAVAAWNGMLICCLRSFYGAAGRP